MKNMNQFLRFPNKKDAEYIAELQAAIYHFEGQEIGAKTIGRYLSQEKLAEFNLVNPYGRKVFREHLLMEVADVEGGVLTVKSGSLARKAESEPCQYSLFIAKMRGWSAPTLSPTPDRHFAMLWPV